MVNEIKQDRSTLELASVIGITPPMEIDLRLPRIYLDSNVLIDALLPEKKPLGKDKQTMKDAAKVLWENWRGPAIRISPHCIAEFIAVGKSAEYRYDFDYLFGVISNEIVPPKCEFIYAELNDDPEISESLNSLQRWTFASFEIEGEATLNGKPIRSYNIGMGFDIRKNLWTKGFAKTNENLTFTKVTSSKYIAPYFELALFKKASEIAINYKIPLGDALHLIYTTPDKIDILVTHDIEHFRSKFDEINKIKIRTAREILDKKY